MDLRSYYNTRICISKSAELGAVDLIHKIKDNTINIDILPNKYQDFTGQLETSDYLSFCKFLESRRGKKILDLMEEWE